MKLNKNSAAALLYLLGGDDTAAAVRSHLPDLDIRSVQRALTRLADLGVVRRSGPVNNPKYSLSYDQLLTLAIPDQILEDEDRPDSRFNHEFIDWLLAHVDELPQAAGAWLPPGVVDTHRQLSARDLEYLTVELSWKSSALEGNTYTLLDTQLLLLEGVKAPNRTTFETQMVLNHKDAIGFIVEHPELFRSDIVFSTVEKLHRIISCNLGIAAGVRHGVVGVGASNYVPLVSPQQLRENADRVLTIVNRAADPVLKSLLGFALVPYLQLFEDGNKRTGRMLANGILISTVGRGFSLRTVQARELSLAYLAFYEFSSLARLAKVLAADLRRGQELDALGAGRVAGRRR